ncbi:MAG: ribosome-associated translation inhibitor RaiA [Candidatus Yonathbacteria bacterium]|nr:ribosome-associated translation inhibitor RaiA [Candidatus Yonathbacteria bacterium]
MQIKIKATNIEITDAISAYVEEKIESVEKFVVPHQKEEVIADIEIGKTTNHHNSGDVFRAEVMVRVRGKQFRAVSQKDDLYAAIDDVRNELIREINSVKGKERTLVRRGAGMIKDLLRFGRAK